MTNGPSVGDMRKLLGILLFFLVAAGLAFAFLPGVKGGQLRAGLSKHIAAAVSRDAAAASPDQAVSSLISERWKELETRGRAQIATELATLDKLKTGQVKLGVVAPQAPAAPVKSPQPIEIPIDKKTAPRPAQIAPAVQKVAVPASITPPAAAEKPGVATVSSPPAQSPEDALGAIITQQDRGPALAPDPFWTEERKQEAINNGEPKSGGPRTCLFLCGKKN